MGNSRAWVWVWVEVSTLPFSPPLPTSLCPKVGRGSQGVPRLPSPCVSPSFISEMKLEGKCNLRRPTKGGRGESNQATSPLGLGTFFSPRPPGLFSPPLQRCSPGLGAGAAPHVTGVPGGWGVPRAGQREDGREGRGSASATAELQPPGPALPSFPARLSLFLIRVTGAVPARLLSVCKRLTRGPSLNPLGAGLGARRGRGPGPEGFRLKNTAACREVSSVPSSWGEMVTSHSVPYPNHESRTNSLIQQELSMPAFLETPVRVFLPPPAQVTGVPPWGPPGRWTQGF